MVEIRAERTGSQRSQLAQFRTLVDSLGSNSFGTSFFSFLNAFIDIDDCTVFVLPRNDDPTCLIAEGKSNRAVVARHAAEEYVSHYYARDANINRLREELRGRMTALRYVHRDSISDSVYRAKFYDEIDIQEKISVLARFDGGYLYSNFYRSTNHDHFDDGQIAVVREISRFALSCLKKHLGFIGHTHNLGDRENRLQAVYRLLTMREGAQLTAREADVCARIILGFSTTAISLDLSITENTVSTLRKRAYERLGICSQNELFALCLEGMIQARQ